MVIIASDKSSDNPCGDCNFCCEHLLITANQSFNETEKPAGELCAAYDSGCTIHETKPKVCASYQCYWLEQNIAGNEMPRAWRPDVAGFCISLRTHIAKIDSIVDVDDNHPILNHLRYTQGDVKIRIKRR